MLLHEWSGRGQTRHERKEKLEFNERKIDERISRLKLEFWSTESSLRRDTRYALLDKLRMKIDFNENCCAIDRYVLVMTLWLAQTILAMNQFGQWLRDVLQLSRHGRTCMATVNNLHDGR